ncbi:hypothetical protein B0H16DRAFT_1461385 [Mycena metata]|uniref:Uncharacterized protein n=1 Tax=Mycena metata TaxID=1033252 RepID=A0AAD7IU29_9AGAR|nr:hypothetical protein B0H16DRAFT_1461385 [Mycena metata]
MAELEANSTGASLCENASPGRHMREDVHDVEGVARGPNRIWVVEALPQNSGKRKSVWTAYTQAHGFPMVKSPRGMCKTADQGTVLQPDGDQHTDAALNVCGGASGRPRGLVSSRENERSAEEGTRLAEGKFPLDECERTLRTTPADRTSATGGEPAYAHSTGTGSSKSVEHLSELLNASKTGEKKLKLQRGEWQASGVPERVLNAQSRVAGACMTARCCRTSGNARMVESASAEVPMNVRDEFFEEGVNDRRLRSSGALLQDM